MRVFRDLNCTTLTRFQVSLSLKPHSHRGQGYEESALLGTRVPSTRAGLLAIVSALRR